MIFKAIKSLSLLILGEQLLSFDYSDTCAIFSLQQPEQGSLIRALLPPRCLLGCNDWKSSPLSVVCAFVKKTKQTQPKSNFQLVLKGFPWSGENIHNLYCM